MKVYLAGPMSGLPDHGIPAFREATARLLELGHHVISPVELDERDGFDPTTDVTPGSEQWIAFLARDVAIVVAPSVDAIVVLPGWEDSRGARLEVHVARELGKPVLGYPDLEPVTHPSSERFHEILRGLGILHDRKRRDYGRVQDPFANVRAATEWGVADWIGAMIRATDKVRRLQTYARTGELANEGAADAFMDLAVYAVIAQVLWEEAQE